MRADKREFTPDEIIGFFEATSASNGRLPCPLIARMKEMRDAGATFAQLEMHYLTEIGPFTPLDIMMTAHRYNGPEMLAEVQEKCAHVLTMHDWPTTRPMLEQALIKAVERITPGALRILVDLFAEKHPAPAVFWALLADRLPAEIGA